MEYYEEALKVTKGAHTPHLIGRAHDFHKRFLETGTMKIKK
jgi:succinyl-CoA:acetate CoA-transferase